MPKLARDLSREIVLPDRQSWPQMRLPELWQLHEQGLTLYQNLHNHVHTSAAVNPQSLKSETSSAQTQGNLLELKRVIAHRLLTDCNFCVHNCRVNRKAGPAGYCQLSSQSTLSGSYIHWGEEAPIRPTWALFFGGCTMHCVYCHNWRETFDLSQTRAYTPESVATDLSQTEQDFKTISFIGGTPEPHLHWILDFALALLPSVQAPFVFNNNATLSQEGLSLMHGVVDIYLPDFKHGNNRCAWQLTKIASYLEHVQANLQAYLEQGAAILVRHLALPGHLECCTRPILERLAQDYPKVTVNIMTQYRPMYRAERMESLKRRLNSNEIQRIEQWVQELNLRQVAA